MDTPTDARTDQLRTPVHEVPPRPEGAVRVATWNLERPSTRSWKKLPYQFAQMRAVDADIWVLTETRASIAPGPEYAGVHTPPHPSRRPDEDERWVGIWSRWSLSEPLLPPSPRGSLAVSVQTPLGGWIVYGTVLPWANEPGDAGVSRMWAEHYAEIERQGPEWRDLVRIQSDAHLVVAGDFNQDRDGSRWYGTGRGRELLSAALDAASLTCLTAADMVAAAQLATNHLVDHICIPRAVADAAIVSVRCWEARAPDGTRMSDHPGVCADIELRVPGEVSSSTLPT